MNENDVYDFEDDYVMLDKHRLQCVQRANRIKKKHNAELSHYKQRKDEELMRRIMDG